MRKFLFMDKKTGQAVRHHHQNLMQARSYARNYNLILLKEI